MIDEHWNRLGTLVKEQTGRHLVGTEGGLYAFTDTEIRVPFGIEGAIHELCHWVVASPEERKQPNLGLSADWQHPGYDRMVRCEELAWSLEFYLYEDIPVEQMADLLTPEAKASGGGVNISSQQLWARRWALEAAIRVEEAAAAELERGKHLVDQQAEQLRREVLLKAEQAGLRVKELKQLIQASKESLKVLPDLEEELRALEKPKAVAKACFAKKLGFTCDRIGKHVEHASEDVRGRAVYTWTNRR